MSAGPFLTGPALTLADLHAAPMFAYFTLAPEAHQLLALYPSLMEWWDRMVTRRSMTSTVYPVRPQPRALPAAFNASQVSGLSPAPAAFSCLA